MLTSVPTVDSQQALGPRIQVVIDLRTPAEFAADHLPGAVNVPLFDDAERVVIGTLYKRESPDRAFAEGRELAERRIVSLVEDLAAAADWCPPGGDFERLLVEVTAGGIETLEATLEARPVEQVPERAVVLHCWRGGLRSRSVVAFVRALGLERAVALAGGYKSYRRHVLDGLAAWQAPPVFVLRGLTGTGKTLVLRELERLRPRWTVDLEGLAGHRSSILGMVGLEPTTQKTFDSALFERLEQGSPGPLVFEGESRKIGDSILPVSVWSALQAGANIHITCNLERRVEVLIEDYLERPENRDQLAQQLPFIEQRLGAKEWSGRLVGLLQSGGEVELVELLLEHYYDPLYRHSETGREYSFKVDSTDPVRAAQEIAEQLEARLRNSAGPPSA